jgi:hypothetical protein
MRLVELLMSVGCLGHTRPAPPKPEDTVIRLDMRHRRVLRRPQPAQDTVRRDAIVPSATSDRPTVRLATVFLGAFRVDVGVDSLLSKMNPGRISTPSERSTHRCARARRSSTITGQVCGGRSVVDLH